MFSVHTTLEELKTQQAQVILDLCSWEHHTIIVTTLFSIHNKTQLFSDVKSVFEKLCFRDGLMGTVGLTIKIKTVFLNFVDVVLMLRYSTKKEETVWSIEHIDSIIQRAECNSGSWVYNFYWRRFEEIWKRYIKVSRTKSLSLRLLFSNCIIANTMRELFHHFTNQINKSTPLYLRFICYKMLSAIFMYKRCATAEIS